MAAHKNTEVDDLEMIEKIASAVSKQNITANRTWLILITIIVVYIFPEFTESSTGHETNIKLPFLGYLPGSIGSLIIYVVISLLTITFSQAHAQGMRAYRLGQSFLSDLETSGKEFKISPRIHFEINAAPALVRVAPIVQLLKSINSDEKKQSPPSAISTFYYILLRVVSTITVFGIPCAILFIGFFEIFGTGDFKQPINILAYAAAFLGATALSSVLIVAVGEFEHTIKTNRKVKTGEIKYK